MNKLIFASLLILTACASAANDARRIALRDGMDNASSTSRANEALWAPQHLTPAQLQADITARQEYNDLVNEDRQRDAAAATQPSGILGIFAPK